VPILDGPPSAEAGKLTQGNRHPFKTYPPRPAQNRRRVVLDRGGLKDGVAKALAPTRLHQYVMVVQGRIHLIMRQFARVDDRDFCVHAEGGANIVALRLARGLPGGARGAS
jgi:hypothetical protein